MEGGFIGGENSGQCREKHAHGDVEEFEAIKNKKHGHYSINKFESGDTEEHFYANDVK